MYINKIDDLLDKVIDDFFNNVIVKDQRLKAIKAEANFVKYQREINDMLSDYIKTINTSEIKELVKNGDTVQVIMNIIKRYVAIYMFLTIGAFYAGKEDTFINNIVEFTKNQPGYSFKVENFFNSENNASIIKYYKLIADIVTIVNTDQTKLSSFLQKPEYRPAIDLLNSLGQEYVDQVFRLQNLNNNVNDQIHNIIKTIIILLIYKKTEKDNVFKILESIENEQGEYTFIDVVVPRRQHINFSTVESLLSKKDLIRGLAHEIWNFILDQDENIRLTEFNSDEKILKLLDSKLIIPVSDELLLYHKDTEKYDKGTGDPTKIKKKEDTKIRYIVTKIDRASEYYSESVQKDPKVKAEVKKLFYMPLLDRKAILYNNNEEIRIINKLINQGRRSIENNEYYNDLIHYRKYPYINFKEFKNYGFSIILDKTIDIVRTATFETEHKERNSIQLRIGSEGQTVNIVGFIIPTNTRPLECLKVKDVMSIRNQTSAIKNGYDLVYKYLQQSNLNTKKHRSSLYWLFDLTLDKVTMDTYEQFNKLNSQEQTKYVIAKLYDDILYEIYYEIAEKLNSFKGGLPFYKSFKIMEQIEKRSMEIPRNSDFFNKLEEKIFYDKFEPEEPRYDEIEDQFFGLSGNIIKLVKIPDRQPPPIQTVKLDIAKIVQKERNIEAEEIMGVCQHNITWENISTLRKKDPNRYSDMLYAFIEQYVVENTEHEYICKSCGYQLNIKKFIIDGVFDDDTERFITLSMPMEVPLEDIPEYEKYIAAIRNIDKLIEKIASVANIPYFLGTASSIKWRRKAVTKDTIDILLMHNTIMKKNFKERNITATKLYGISRELSNLFVFDLDNSIFVYSSKERDYFKNIKHNNVIAYIIILMILEINNSHIAFMSGDKKGLCNFSIFEKFGNALFEGIKIRKNKAGDLTEIKRYKILCYILYIVSCMATRYNLWHYEFPDETGKPSLKPTLTKTTKKGKMDPRIQKVIIHTVVDILNSLLEVSSQKGAHRLYEMISTKFYKKMRETFANNSIIALFQSNEKSSIATERKDFIFTKIPNISLTGKKIVPAYDIPHYRKCREARYFVKPRSYTFEHYFHINNVTNCPTGEFHHWLVSGGKYVCTRCATSIDTPFDAKLTELIQRTFKYVALQQLAHKYCQDGTLHNFIYSDEQTCSVCSKCKLAEKYEFTHEELDKLDQSVMKFKNQVQIQTEHERALLHEEATKEKEYEERVLDKLEEHYKRDNPPDSPYRFIDSFLNNVQVVIGEETNINNANILLKDNIYIIDHDHLGYPLDKPIVISDRDNRITYKSNHPFFKTDVIYYTSHKVGKLDVFYDATTHILLGYKENSKDFVSARKTDKKIKISYSIANKLKLLGYSSQYINIADQYEKLAADVKDLGGQDAPINREDLMKELLETNIRKRIYNLKKVISEFQRFIWRIKNNTSMEVKLEKLDSNRADFTNIEDNLDPFTKLLEKYQKKLSSVNLQDSNGNHKVFKHWKAVTNNLFAESLEDKVINVGSGKLLNAEEISKYDNNGNLLLYYIVSEMDKVIVFNQNKFTKTNAIMFMMDFISLVFNIFNTDEIFNTFDIKRFMYIIRSHGYLYDIEQKGHGLADTEGIYDEYKDPDDVESEEQIEANDEAEEEAQALDVDMSFDAALDNMVQIDDWEPEHYSTIEG